MDDPAQDPGHRGARAAAGVTTSSSPAGGRCRWIRRDGGRRRRVGGARRPVAPRGRWRVGGARFGRRPWPRRRTRRPRPWRVACGVVGAPDRPTKRPSSRSRGDRPPTVRAAGSADRQPNAPRRPPAGSSSPWIARASPASVRLRTIRARSTRLIWPFSSDTTTTTASVCSVMPRAARWRVPKRSVWIDVSASGSSAPAATIRSSRMITAPSWSGDFGREDRAQQVGRHVAVDHHPGLGDLLEAGLALEHDQGALAVGRQLGRGARDLGRDVLDGARLGRRQEPAERADPADPLERPPQLRLEDDDEGEQADDGAGLEDLGEQPQVERDGQRVDQRRARSRRSPGGPRASRGSG